MNEGDIMPALLACMHMRQATGAAPFGKAAESALPCCISCQLAAGCALSGKRMSNPGQCMTNISCLLSTWPAFKSNVGLVQLTAHSVSVNVPDEQTESRAAYAEVDVGPCDVAEA